MSHFSCLVIGAKEREEIDEKMKSFLEDQVEWYQIGGRWENLFDAKEGDPRSIIQKKDVDWKKLEEEYQEGGNSHFYTFAVIDQHNKWHSLGQMGIFACYKSNMPKEEWMEKFFSTFIEPLPEETWLAIVDCHQ